MAAAPALSGRTACLPSCSGRAAPVAWPAGPAVCQTRTARQWQLAAGPAAPLLASAAGFGGAQSARRAPLGVAHAALADVPWPTGSERGVETVADVMTKGKIHCVREWTPIDNALEMLVEYKISGLPVVDDDERVVGVVSDFDLLSLEGVQGKMEEAGMFPDTNTNWQAFFEVQKLILKNAGKVVADVMTPEPFTVRDSTNLEAAARILLRLKIRRLPVVDEEGRLVGMFTRSDVIRAALRLRRSSQPQGFMM